MLRGRFEAPCTVAVSLDKDGTTFRFKARRAKPAPGPAEPPHAESAEENKP